VIGILKKLLWDEAYATQYLKVGMMALAAGLLSGQIDLGPLGWWGGWLSMIASQFVKNGERND
jgi:hypothetical protein